jgi:hypothetical protein
VKRVFPKVFWALLLYGLYVPMGPWMLGPIFDNQLAVMFAWGIMPLGGATPRLPHYDSDITLVQVFLLGIAPALQLASMAAVWQARAGAGSAALVSMSSDGPTTTLVAQGSVWSPVSLGAMLLWLMVLLHWAVLCLPAIVIHGVVATLLAPVHTWVPLAMMLLGLRAILCHAWGRCVSPRHPGGAGKGQQKEGKDA